MTTSNRTIPDGSPLGSTKTAPSAVHQDGGVKCATGASLKIRGKDNITIDTWNTSTLKAAGKLQELTHEIDRYRWDILRLSEMRWKNFGETTTAEGHKVFFSGKEHKHEHGVGFLVHKDIVNTVIGCRPVFSRLITIRLRAVPFNIRIVQACAPTSDYDDNEIEELYDQLQNVIDQTPKKDILVVQGSSSSSSSIPLIREGRWGTTDNFATSFLHCPLFSTAFWHLPNSRPVHFLMLSSPSSSVCLVFFSSSPFHYALQNGFGQT